MALAATTIFESRATGSDTSCSGGFNPGNANFATDGAATSATGNSPVFTSASYVFVVSDINAWVFIKAGTNWLPGWYLISGISGSGAILTASIGTSPSWSGTPGVANVNSGLNYVANTVAGCATTASPSGATWGIDYSQQDSARFSFTDMVIDATTNTKFTSVGNPVSKNFVGNLIKITSGTGFTVQTVEVVSTTGTTATCDKSLGTLSSTGGNGFLGGAFAGPQLAAALGLGGNFLWVKSGSYTINNSSSNVANGLIAPAQALAMFGYGTLRGDVPVTNPTFTASGISSVTLISTGGTINRYINVDGASLSTITGIGGSGNLFDSKASNCTTGISSVLAVRCIADTCTTGFTSTIREFCVAKSCTTGFSAGTSSYWCLAHTCTTGFLFTSIKAKFCTAYNCATGFSCASAYIANLYRCIAHTSSSFGFSWTGSGGTMDQCAAYLSGTDVNYASNAGGAAILNTGFIPLTADPFISVGSNNFALNNVTGGGALLRNLILNFPSNISTSSYPDVGMAQHFATPGGSYTFS